MTRIFSYLVSNGVTSSIAYKNPLQTAFKSKAGIGFVGFNLSCIIHAVDGDILSGLDVTVTI